MPSRPLLILPAPSEPANRRKKTGGDDRIHLPKHGRQVARLEPRFEAIQDEFARLQTTAEDTTPEQVLVIEIVSDVENFITAVQRVPGMEWMGEFEEEDIPPDEDFFAVDKHQKRKTDKQLRGRLYLVFTNQRALNQLLSLWNTWKKHKHLPIGLRKWKDVFNRLLDIRPWGARDRLLDTGVLIDWRERVQYNEETVPCEIELWFRHDAEHRRAAAERVKAIVAAQEGTTVAEASIEDIRYHALLVRLPIASIQPLLAEALQETELIQCEQIQFLRAVGQMAAEYSVDERETEPAAQSVAAAGRPVAALFDGLPLQSHQRLAGRLIVDDPDNFEARYGAAERCHGTAMASLILNGDLGDGGRAIATPLYVRPIMLPDSRAFNLPRPECVPEDVLLVDLIHRAVRRMLVGDGQEEPTAPTVRIVNLSIGIGDRPFDGPLSPLARLLDWMAWQYGVLFMVSAGNCGQPIELPLASADYAALTRQQIEDHVLKVIAADTRNRRLLSPAEALNAITVAATHTDTSTGALPADRVDPYTKMYLPSAINAQGMGYRRAIKPEVLMPGGRTILVRDLTGHAKVKFKPYIKTQAPGQKVAAPGVNAGDTGAVCYTRGTSNAAALATRAGVSLNDVLEELRAGPGGDLVNLVPTAVWLKALLVHGASWGRAWEVLEEKLKTPANSRQFREYVTRLLGYGTINVNRVSECAAHRVTALGGGTLTDGQAHTHLFPLPPSLSKKAGLRRLIVTLAWMTPINARHQRWRRADLWFNPAADKLDVTRQEAEHRASQRGTVQHEILEGERAAAFVDGDSIEIQVSCRADAGALEDEVPYALAVTLEVAQEIGIDIYDEVRARIRAAVVEVVRV